MDVRMERYKLSNPLYHHSFQKPCTRLEDHDQLSKTYLYSLLEKSQLDLSALVYHHILKLAQPRAGFARCEGIQSVHLVKVLYRSQHPKLIR